ncbi:hypothetical protein BGX23_001036 [Mortierella sp. AD031]|nr:hypothetical protein BGX23_001036 [Mortierella sp. AD031]
MSTTTTSSAAIPSTATSTASADDTPGPLNADAEPDVAAGGIAALEATALSGEERYLLRILSKDPATLSPKQVKNLHQLGEKHPQIMAQHLQQQQQQQ